MVPAPLGTADPRTQLRELPEHGGVLRFLWLPVRRAIDGASTFETKRR
jgi:hypothetical protein